MCFKTKTQLKVKKLLIPLFFLIALHNTTLIAQRGWEIGGWAGVTHYFGDLNTRFDITHPNVGLGAVARFNFNERLCFKFSGNYGRIAANDAWSSNAFERQRNLHFRSTIVDGTGALEFNFLEYSYFTKNTRFSPYISLGLSAFYFNPEAKYQDKWVKLRPLGTEGQFQGEEYYTAQPALAYGFGFKWALNEYWSLNFELSARRLFTDYLDDVSTTYPKMNDLMKARGATAVALSDPSIPDSEGLKIGAFGRQRGDKRTNDAYTFFGVSLLYYFGDLRCPTISSR